ncbi:MAG: prephenate dehydratase domain-containing protein [Clostridia bacterium]|nr:prephenate dehydratase domain-containing protein [Clostridia bacterium]
MKEKLKNVYCQGVKGAYSHIAAKEMFGKEPVFLRSFEDVCRSAANEENSAGILPSENSTAGMVSGIIHLLLKYKLYINYAKTMEISHLLCAKEDVKAEDIKVIYSHQQAFLQCSDYLNTLKAEQIETLNTASSALLALKQSGSAAICSKEAADIYGLKVIRDNICNREKNSTRFIVVSNQNHSVDNSNVTSVYFKAKNQSGSLYRALKVFYRCNINLTAIHSLPLEEESWHYGFYADMEGSITSHKKCLEKLKAQTEYLKILGSYISI